MKQHIYIICLYIPPNSSHVVYMEHLKAVQLITKRLKATDLFVVLGDFNIPSVTWHQVADSNCLTPSCINLYTSEFINGLLQNCLFQINSIHNAFGKLLDLIFVSEPSDFCILRHDPLSLPEDVYHPTLELNSFHASEMFNNTPPPSQRMYCFKRTNYDLLKFHISNIDWINMLSRCIDLDESVDLFYRLLDECFSIAIPKVRPITFSGPPWNTKQLSRLKNKKNKFYKLYKKSRSTYNYMKYSIARANYNSTNQICYKNYLRKINNNMKSNPRSFFNFVNSKRRSTDYPTTMKLGDLECSDDLSISNMFADFFESTYSLTESDNIQSYPYFIKESMGVGMTHISEESVYDYLNKLKFSCVAGIDGVPSCILIRCAKLLHSPLSFIFNKSIQHGYFPSIWKKSIIIPLFKSGSKNIISNYRGIAKLSVIPKMFEKIVYDRLSHQVTSLISSTQHGFRSSHSTITNILELTSIVNEGFVNGKQTDVIYTDFSKAFDKISIKLLVHKLDKMAFNKPLLKWINSYLVERKQCVKFRNTYSRYIEVISGVPQGSHLGPLLFILFINDLPSVIRQVNCLIYADDVKMFHLVSSHNDQIKLQSDLNNFSRWCDLNFMTLNINKCKYMVFCRKTPLNGEYTINNTFLQLVESFNDLGILLDRKLDFRAHISATVNKASAMLGYIKRWSKEFSDPYTTKTLFTTLVRPILEYGSVVWDPQYSVHIKSIESVQKQFLLFCLRGLGWASNDRLPSYKARLALIKLPTLESRRIMLNITFLLKLINGSTHSEFLLSKIFFNVPNRPTRFFTFLRIPYYVTNYANADAFRRICEQFNQFYYIIDFNNTLSSIKRELILILNN